LRRILAVDPMPLIPDTHKSHSAYVQYGSIWSEADRDPPPGRSAALSQIISKAVAAVNERRGEVRVEHLETTDLVDGNMLLPLPLHYCWTHTPHATRHTPCTIHHAQLRTV
jgi:hypothetical protein